jgi:uncharacterized LabA/DUF88 family protein
LYTALENYGYTLVFKEVVLTPGGSIKGNVDAELVLQAMIEYENYEKAIIVSGDGDFSCLARYLDDKNKLETILVPNQNRYSQLLRRAANAKISFLDKAEEKLAYPKNEKPHLRTEP